MGNAQWAIENGLDPFMRPDGEEWEGGMNPIYVEEENYDSFNDYEDDDIEDSLETFKTRLVEVEISLKKLNDEKEYILNELMALLDKSKKKETESKINYEENDQIVHEIDIREDEIPF